MEISAHPRDLQRLWFHLIADPISLASMLGDELK